jgi:hypothetical protein
MPSATVNLTASPVRPLSDRLPLDLGVAACSRLVVEGVGQHLITDKPPERRWAPCCVMCAGRALRGDHAPAVRWTCTRWHGLAKGCWLGRLGWASVQQATVGVGCSEAWRDSKVFHFFIDLFKGKSNSIRFEFDFLQICSNRVFGWI